jgi:hypothetical protein
MKMHSSSLENEYALAERARKRKRDCMEECELLSQRVELQAKRLSNIDAFMRLMTTIDPNWKSDARLVSQTKKALVKALLSLSSEEEEEEDD